MAKSSGGESAPCFVLVFEREGEEARSVGAEFRKPEIAGDSRLEITPPPQFSCQASDAQLSHGRMYRGRVGRHALVTSPAQVSVFR